MSWSGWEGTAKATRDFIPTMNQALHDQNLVGMQVNRLAVEKQRNDILEKQRLEQAALAKEQTLALQEKRAENERDNSYMDFEESLHSVGITSPKEKAFFMERAKPYVEQGPMGRPVWKRKYGRETMIGALKDPGARVTWAEIKGEDYGNRLKELNAMLGLSYEGLDPEKAEEFKKQSAKMKPEDQEALKAEKAELVDKINLNTKEFKRAEQEFKAKTKQTQPGLTLEDRIKLKQTPPGKAPSSDTGEKDKKQALADDYTNIRKSYQDIIKNSKDDNVVEAAKRGLQYLPGIRGNRAKLDEAMNWLADPYNPQTSVPTKTVTIEGKEYRDGDIVTQNGKQFRVKVK